jgi:hypothetical protein
MTRNPDNPEQRLEDLLRQWGAREAIQEVSIPAPPRVEPARRTGWWVRWSPALAAAMLLLTAGILFYGTWRTGQQHQPDRVAEASPDRQQKTETILTRLDRLEEKFQAQPDVWAEADAAAPSPGQPEEAAPMRHARRATGAEAMPAGDAAAPAGRTPAPAPVELESLQDKLRDQQERLNQVEASQAKGQEALAKLAEVQRELDRKDDALNRMRKEKQALAGQVELARRRYQSLFEQVRRLEARLPDRGEADADSLAVRSGTGATRGPGDADSPAVKAAARPADDTDIADGAQNAATRTDPEQLAALHQKLEALDRRHRQLRESFEIAYRSAMAPGQTGLAAWQTVVTRSRLIERSARAGQDSSSARTRKLVEQIEFVLTRLSLTDPQQPRAGENLARWVAQRKLIEAIDRTLAGAEEIDRLNAWLLEARAVLKGIRDVG